MSRFSTLSAKERKMQAAAINREVQGCNGDTMDLGKKLCTPKDIMLEELSLSSNRGSRLFKMRQRRSDKYTFESIQNEANVQLNNDVQTQDNGTAGEGTEAGAKTPPNTPDQRNTESAAPGEGEEAPSEKFNATAIPKSYHSPWEQAIIHDPSLAETLNVKMAAPEPKAEGPDFKSFNRVATPFGGFDRAPRGFTFKLPEVDLSPPKYPELQDPGSKRPSFNRTAQGWISDFAPPALPSVEVEPPDVPESDDL